MEKENVLFRLAGALAALFTGSQTDEDERLIEEWKAGDERREALAAGIMNKARFEKHRALLDEFPAREAWEKFEARVTGKRRRPWRQVARYAAAVFLVSAGAGIVYFSSVERVEERVEVAVERPFLSSGTTGARLMLADGSVVAIGKETVMAVTERDGTTILVDSGSMDYREPAAAPVVENGDGEGDGDAAELINEVSTPSGMEFPVTLSDGTRVHLNAESRLHFPTRFTGGVREVILEGEAFFKVTSDAARPFVVHAAGVDVRVTGTEFNLRAYAGERAVAATLVEGRVTLARGGREWSLRPGTQARYDKAGERCEIRAVDTDHYTAWQSGHFIFRNERLEDVLGYLARWYGFEYEFADDDARDVLIGAHLNRYSDMDPIIRIIEETRLARVAVVPGSRIVIRSYK